MTIELGNRLAELRKEHGLSQEELADKLGVSRQAVSKWERGEASPDTDNLIELAKIYNISLDELLGLSEPKQEKEKHPEDEETGIHIHGKVHIKDEDGNEVRVDEHGIHVKDEDGPEVRVTGAGVHIVNEDGERHVHVKINEKHRITGLVSLITTFTVIISYILLGFLAGLWGQAWVLFLLIPLTPTISEAIIKKNLNIFAYPIFLVFIYFLLCSWVLPATTGYSLWHPLWVMFLTIPVYYGVINFIKPDNDQD